MLHLGPLPIHYYALCIVTGILLALYSADRRWLARGGKAQQIGDVAGWTVLSGILGGRIYHVITDPELYFGAGRHPIDALKIWDGGLGIWGAVMLGALGGYIGCRRQRMNFLAFADTVAPGIVLAQGVGRLGNWFNNELYGRVSTLPWRLQIHSIDVVTGDVVKNSAGRPAVLGYFQPTFLYELVWDLAVAGLLVWADRRFRLGRGNVFALYVMGYTAGRFWIEALRSDHANRVLGMRVNSWVAILLFLGALLWFVRHRHSPRSSAAGEAAAGSEVVGGPGGPGGPDSSGGPDETAGPLGTADGSPAALPGGETSD